jgi:hypothetical protein
MANKNTFIHAQASLHRKPVLLLCSWRAIWPTFQTATNTLYAEHSAGVSVRFNPINLPERPSS